MNIIRPLIVCVIGFLLTLPLESYAANKKVIIGFHRKPELLEHNLVHSTKGRIRRVHSKINALAVELPEEEISRIKNDTSVAYVVDDVSIKPIESIQTQMPLSSDYSGSWGVMKIGADTAANRGFKGAGVKVGIIDSGIDYNHPDLKDNYKGGYNFIDNNSDPYDDDSISHGTRIAGIIAAKDNGTGVVGVAPEASLYAIKIFGANGAGGDLSTIIAGIDWAIDNGMNVVNLSTGFDSMIAELVPETFRPLKEICDLAYIKGIVMVAAAGNEGRDRVPVPAAYESVIAVSATDQSNQSSIFINGKTSNYGTAIDLAAPGSNIISTIQGGGYAVESGTSFAAPHIAGAVAVVLSMGIRDANNDGNLAEEARQILSSTATDLGTPGRDTIFGWGLVDLAAATAQVDTRQVHLVKTKDKPKNSSVKVQLSKGFYTVVVVNSTLNKIVVKTSDINVQKNEPEIIDFLKMKHRNNRGMEIHIDHDDTTLEFIPHGREAASADITITKIGQPDRQL